jgi:DNA-binding transcriptional MerR regulator
MKFEIDCAAKYVGVPPATLRNWENRFKVIIPYRSTGGHRLYDLEQVLLLRRVADLKKKGESLKTLFDRIKANEPLPVMSHCELNEDFLESRQTCLDHLLEYRPLDASLVLDNMHRIYHLKTLLLDLYHWIFNEIGEAWAEGRVSISKEHYVTSYLLARLYRILSVAQSRAGRTEVIVALESPEEHEGGALILAILLKTVGMEVMFAGKGFPVLELENLVREVKPKVLCLSYNYTAPNWTQLFKLASNLDSQVCIGGRGLNNSPTQKKDWPENLYQPEKYSSDFVDVIRLLAS